MFIAQPRDKGIAEFGLTPRTLFVGNRVEGTLEDPPQVFRNGDMRICGIRASDGDPLRLQGGEEPRELFGEKLLVQAGSRFIVHCGGPARDESSK
ncbi:MAG TPA: hypothetical protein VNE16_08805, partial [Vicinamibacterales bacterium]|nr:hypothetical protein [Vicinamibacterales bacterium]